MKPVLVFIVYVVGFVVFYQIMSFLKVDEYILFFLTPNTDNSSTQTLPQAQSQPTKTKNTKKQKEGDIVTPPDGTKPLALTKQEIGRHAWAVLHSVAATFPAIPTDEDKKSVEDFIKGLALNFPCKICSKHFVKILEGHPIQNESREDLVLYMCEIHNIVNKFLEKPIFDCTKAFDIWGGDCGCDA